MPTRRSFLLSWAALPLASQSKMTPRERVNRLLRGDDVDRLAFTFWYHFGLEKEPPEKFAQATLDFHRKFRTDLVKVMSDFPYPQDSSKVYDSPFPAQIRALDVVRNALDGRAHFIETIFNPWNVAEKLTSKEEVQRMKTDQPQQLLDLLERIAQSEANHARKAISAGASGIFLAIANAQRGILTLEEYRKFSEPFDRMVLDAAQGAPLNVLHLHGDKVHLKEFTARAWPAAINFSHVATGVGLADVRARFNGVLLGGIDEVSYRKLTRGDLIRQARAARAAAGRKLILAPGCSVPDETTDEEMLRLTEAVGA